MRLNLDHRFDDLELKIDRVEDCLTIRMGVMFVVSIGIFIALQKLL